MSGLVVSHSNSLLFQTKRIFFFASFSLVTILNRLHSFMLSKKLSAEELMLLNCGVGEDP